jgi:hypothetical protein
MLRIAQRRLVPACLYGRVLCCRCLRKHSVFYRCEPTGPRQRAALQIPKLRAMLDAPQRLRLKPSTMTSKLERRVVHEASLQRHLAVLRNADLASLGKALDKPDD